ncbi:MAG: NAD-dependent epimerase/dehydratase family protein [Desulfuromonadaceae bacterium]
MRVLITGVTGFVGACLARKFLELGHEIHAFARPESNLWRIADIVDKIFLHNVDLRAAQVVEGVVGTIKPECIFHLATYGGFSLQQNSEDIFATNLLGTINLVAACEKIGFAYFVNTGSSSEYGAKSHAMKESDQLDPRGDYGVSKAAATLFCRSEALQKKLPIISLRIFSPYGPWDDPKRFIPYVISSLLNKTVPTLSTPDSVRDYIFIDDVIAAYVAVSSVTIVPGAIYNVGSGTQTSIGDVTSAIVDKIGGNLIPAWGMREIQRTEPATWVADISALTSYCNWRPSVSLKDGLQLTIDWITTNLSRYAI